ncbi:Neurotrypsin, partial [Geodia barretti]
HCLSSPPSCFLQSLYPLPYLYLFSLPPSPSFCFSPSDEENACESGAVRLVGGETFNEGRLEVCFLGHWGTVCDDEFDNVDAAVVCGQLGLQSEGAIALPLALYGGGVGVIFLDDVDCLGNETRLEDCFYPGEIGESNCLHVEDASILCPSNETKVCDNGDVRLVGGSGNYSGRVEVCFNNAWGTVCDDDWDTGDAEVVCKQLGFDPMGSLALRNAFFGQGTGAIFLDDANCSPQNHSTLIECFASIDASVGDHDCQHREDASVVCSSDCEDCNCTNGDLRLRGGATELEGRVEVCINGVWGTICRNFWDGPDAAVVCKQLGLAQTDAAAVTDGRFGAGTGVILWNNFLCRGTEEALLECYHERPQNGTCSHLQDVGVRCSRFVCNNGDIRLADGPYDSDGRLEICFDQRYGAICDNGFGSTEAAIACRQLGYNDGQGAIALPNGFFGFGPPITTSRVSCTARSQHSQNASTTPTVSVSPPKLCPSCANQATPVAPMEISDWLAVLIHTKGEWRCVSTATGAASVRSVGPISTPSQCAP